MSKLKVRDKVKVIRDNDDYRPDLVGSVGKITSLEPLCPKARAGKATDIRIDHIDALGVVYHEDEVEKIA